MKRKYLDDLGIKHEDTPQGWNPNDKRQDSWREEREEYGFDERETWELDYTFKIWLYERLSMYNEINCIDTTFYEFEYKGEILTQQDCINRILEGLRYDLMVDTYSPERKHYQDEIDSILPLFNLCLNSLWW